MFEKKIDGYIFHVQSHHKDKASADKEAKWLRKNGKPACILAKHYGDKSVRYLVYIR